MRLVFIGASKFGLRCLRLVSKMPELKVAGVVTNPETFSISYRPAGVKNINHADFKSFAEERGVPLVNMTGKMTDPELVSQIKMWQPDFILVVGWYHMIPKSIRELAPTAGLHASILPDYSGGAPLVWAMINGETETGISFFLMNENVDGGPLIGQKKECIAETDTIATLYQRIEEKGLLLLKEKLPDIASGKAAYTVQDERKRRLMPQRAPKDGKINWTWSARAVYNFVRAQTRPYPGAYALINNELTRIWKVSIIETKLDYPNALLGDVVNVLETGLVVKCQGAYVLVEDYEKISEREMREQALDQ